MTGRVYTLREYVELMNTEIRDFYGACRLAASGAPVGDDARTLDDWDRMFDEFTAERRSEPDPV